MLVLQVFLLAPNNEETFEDVEEGLKKFLNWLFEGASVELDRDQRQRFRFSVRVRVPGGATSVEALLSRLGPTLQVLN